VDDVLKDGFVGRARRRPSGDTGICEDDVEPAEISGKCREELLTVFGYGDICAVTAGVRSKFGDGFVQRLLVTAGNRDLGAFSNEKTGGGKTDAAVASGDESFLPASFITPPVYDSGASLWCPSYMLSDDRPGWRMRERRHPAKETAAKVPPSTRLITGLGY
jgi:hypothetical protein